MKRSGEGVNAIATTCNRHHTQGNRTCIFIAPNVLWLHRSKCFLPPISKDKRGSVRQSELTARIQAIGYTGDRLIGVHPCLSAAKKSWTGQSITSGRRVGISNAIALPPHPFVIATRIVIASAAARSAAIRCRTRCRPNRSKFVPRHRPRHDTPQPTRGTPP